MTDWYLRISSYAGVVPWAKHFRGRVVEEFTRCPKGHGHTSRSHGKTTCVPCGTIIPDPREWDVEGFWSEAKYTRYANASFEGDGPAQFTDKAELIKVAVQRWTGETPDGYELYDRWWEDGPKAPSQPGDRLILGDRMYVLEDTTLHEEWKQGTVPDEYPCLIAVIP